MAHGHITRHVTMENQTSDILCFIWLAGKDVIIFASKEDHEKPTEAVLKEEEEDEEPGRKSFFLVLKPS